MSFLRQLCLYSVLMSSMAFSLDASAAANLSFSPVQVNLFPANKTGLLTVTNKGSAAVNLQLDAKAWDMDENGKFLEVDTGDFVFYPKTITIKPQEEVAIRVGYMGAFPNVEKPYRLYLNELPAISTPETEKSKVKVGVTSLLSISMPIYISPAKEVPAVQIALGELRPEAQKLRVGIKNMTAFHVNLNKVAVKLLKGKTTLADKSAELKLERILGEHQLFIDLPLDAKKLCQQADAIAIQIDADNLNPAYQATVPLKAGCLQ